MPTPFLREELPQTLSRLKWAAKIRVSPDLSDITGFPQAVTAALAASNSTLRRTQFSSLVANNSQIVGAIQSLEIIQNRGLVERFGFSGNSQEAFQIAPVQFTKTLKMTKALVRSSGVADKVFNFAPNNLAFQQTPFIIELHDPGINGSGDIDHYFFGCWFADSVVRYDVGEAADSRLLLQANIKCGRLITLDDSSAGGLGSLIAGEVFGGILAIDDVQNVIDDLELT